MRIIIVMLLAILGLVSTAFAHEHHPPHKGVLIVLGEEFAHLELVLDSATGNLTAFSLDGEAENAVALTQKDIVFKITTSGERETEISLKAVENPLTGETMGNTSEFSAQSDSLKGVIKFFGIITDVMSKGQEFKNVAFSFPEGNDHENKGK